ncbi:alpha/beta fold hydrolase [Prochlorococcus marinus]|uniref:Possible alpha/beta hydrolase superfamily n=1 Tax=Prochlorococcus marinus (strain MIT 9211) TaxID=93059 RepID=A9BD73_PROM4|nr:alpha/beta fold hydrolase [Prochlorococcus marinus]ABX09686.1 possible alpha/beta hydrolase superfamily [Prochlorococcus marinus str. MIT 9211]
MTKANSHIWEWNDLNVSWKVEGSKIEKNFATLLVHGFGASKEHWRQNQKILGEQSPCYSIDLIGFGSSSQPRAKLDGDLSSQNDFSYNFDNWSHQIAEFSQSVIKKPVILIGNSIGGVIALRAAQIMKSSCKGVILINCAQRTMDDKRLYEQPKFMRHIRPLLKALIRKRWLSKNLFKNAANPKFIRKVLEKAYPSGANIDTELINMIHSPTQREGASEAFHGFVNIFNDYLATELMENLDLPVDLIWGESDPWEAIDEARYWASSINCVRSLEVINGAGHCPHDECPEKVNNRLLKIIQDAT